MKKIFLFFALLAGIAVMTGCQKDQDVVTLKAFIDQDTKAYFGGTGENTPYWDGNDEVYIKGLTTFPTNTFGLTNPSTTFATIEGVPASDVYCAIFPASAFLEMGTPNAGTDGTTAKITFKHDQVYSEENNRQRLEMPMGAVTTDNTLIFKNLCGILRVKVVNTSGNTFNVKRVSVISEDGTFIAGDGNVTLYKNGDPAVSMSSHHTYTVDQAIQLHAPNYSSMGTINNGQSKTFDIIVPPFTTQALTFDVESIETGTGFGFFSQTVGSTISVARNEIAEVTLTINQFEANNHAYLIDGPTFNSRIKTLDGIEGVTSIWFGNPAVNMPTTPNTEDHVYVVRLDASYSPNPIYGYIDPTEPTILKVNANIQTNDPVEFYSHADCSEMFADLPNIISILFNLHRFITEDATNMSRMFAGCTHLNNVPQLGTFVTTNVETMAYMFDGCSAHGDLDLRHFSTQHLVDTGMVGMFRGCSSIQNLYLNYFTTEQITTMKYLFKDCHAMQALYINSFDMTNVTDKTDMLLGLGAVHPYWGATIYCNSDTWNAISTGTGLPTNAVHGE
ncbi:MAG: BspA family leucine-rich repeat surface protein [Bacteroidales bacterium]|nr:BspA family leucine-rich repeat surface protein [Bacteroidales bacterium]